MILDVIVINWKKKKKIRYFLINECINKLRLINLVEWCLVIKRNELVISVIF